MSQQVDSCTCYCCPSIRNPYGADEFCDLLDPPWVGDFPIGNEVMCSSIGCYTHFSIICPLPPIRGPRNESGSIRWGCQQGCRYGRDGLLQNQSTTDPGFELGMFSSARHAQDWLWLWVVGLL
jgi:hypothetical protein